MTDVIEEHAPKTEIELKTLHNEKEVIDITESIVEVIPSVPSEIT